jgi:hypothetical protein
MMITTAQAASQLYQPVIRNRRVRVSIGIDIHRRTLDQYLMPVVPGSSDSAKACTEQLRKQVPEQRTTGRQAVRTSPHTRPTRLNQRLHILGAQPSAHW